MGVIKGLSFRENIRMSRRERKCGQLAVWACRLQAFSVGGEMDVRREVKWASQLPPGRRQWAAFCASGKRIQVLASVTVTGSLEIEGREMPI